MEGEDSEAIKKATEDLAQSAHKLAEAMYAKTQGAEGEAAGAEHAGGSKPKDDNVVDADFEEVKSDKK